MLKESHMPDFAGSTVLDDATPEEGDLSLLDRTRQQYDAMTPEQQRDFKIALGCTLGGVALNAVNTLVFEPKVKDSDNIALRWAPTAIRGVCYGLDKADGYFAKRTREYGENGEIINPGATTDLGALLDPLADKLNNLINEIAAIRTHDQLPIHMIIRVLRDIAVSYKRSQALKETDGNLSVAANQWGQINTTLRDIANTYAASPVGEANPAVTELLQTLEDISSIVSGAYTINSINKGVANYREQQV